MTVEEAIKTAIQFETKVRDTYAHAAEAATDPAAQRVLRVLATEEQGHLDYLSSRLTEWSKEGKVLPAVLKTVLPAREKILEEMKKVRKQMHMGEAERKSALETLKRAQDVETETSAFYERMVATLPDAGAKAMFARFLEIEEGHNAFVAAEIDSVTGLGFWFDLREFDLEAG